jgi:excisionase family DNA binding protein
MEKICIVKRRRIGQGTGAAHRLEVDDRSQRRQLTIELTPEQMKRVRSNDCFRHIYGASRAPIFLSLHLETPFPMKMLKSEQICDMLQVSKSTLARLVKAGTFRSHRIGRLRRFAAEDVMEYLSKDIEIKSLRSVGAANIPVRSNTK